MAPSQDDPTKELTRKLFWAISSSLPGLTRQQKASTFTWAADMAERVLTRIHPSLPPAVDSPSTNDYHGQAVGRGGGRNRSSLPSDVRLLPPPNMPAWERSQAAMRARAWAHVQKGRTNGHQLPIPDGVYREVGDGSSNSSSEIGGDSPVSESGRGDSEEGSWTCPNCGGGDRWCCDRGIHLRG